MRRTTALLLLAVAVPSMAYAQSRHAAPISAAAAPFTSGEHYTTEETDLGTLLDDPAAKAVLQKYVPTLIANAQIDMARSMTLRSLQSYAADQLTDETLAKIDAELAKVPVEG